MKFPMRICENRFALGLLQNFRFTTGPFYDSELTGIAKRHIMYNGKINI